MNDESEQLQHFINTCIRKSGEHILVGGATGTGKTQTLYHLIHEMVDCHPKETLVWFDTGKSSEILTLAQFRPLKVFIPAGAGIHIPEGINAVIEHFDNAAHILSHLDKDRINIVCIEPYFIEVKDYLEILLDVFKTLIYQAKYFKLPVPMAIFVDELQAIAPSQGNALNKKHKEAGVQMQRNIEQLRSLKIRIVGATQDWTKLRKGVRQSFTWLIVRRGMMFSHFDMPSLASYNPIFIHLGQEQGIIVLPDRHFYQTKWSFPYYKKSSAGEVTYYQKEMVS